MCKILVLTNTAKLSSAQLNSVIKAANGAMTSERHGFGFAAWGTKGIFGERHVNPKHYGKALGSDFGPAANVVAQVSNQDAFGAVGKPCGGLIVHGRTSTNDISLINTHPLENDRYALIHNGVVENIGAAIQRRTTNDTEFVLEHYSQGGMPQVAASVAGYYAVGAIDKTNGNTIVFRDATAGLFVAWSETLQSYFFGTRPELIKAAFKALKLKCPTIADAAENFHAVFSASGALIESSAFTPARRSFGKLDQLSLGAASDKSSEVSWAVSWASDDLPAYRYDTANDTGLSYYDKKGYEITEDQFESLTVDEQNECSIFNGDRKIT